MRASLGYGWWILIINGVRKYPSWGTHCALSGWTLNFSMFFIWDVQSNNMKDIKSKPFPSLNSLCINIHQRPVELQREFTVSEFRDLFGFALPGTGALLSQLFQIFFVLDVWEGLPPAPSIFPWACPCSQPASRASRHSGNASAVPALTLPTPAWLQLPQALTWGLGRAPTCPLWELFAACQQVQEKRKIIMCVCCRRCENCQFSGHWGYQWHGKFLSLCKWLQREGAEVEHLIPSLPQFPLELHGDRATSA